MGDRSTIEWTDATWNPIVGCSIVSPGCTNCYAMGMAARINKMTLSSHYEGLTRTVNGKQVWTGKVVLAPDHILIAPLHWKKPRRIFVNSMGDLFHESIPAEWIDRVFAVMALAPQHTFQVLTKRAERMRDYLIDPRTRDRQARVNAKMMAGFDAKACDRLGVTWNRLKPWPLPNVWAGISAERQQEFDERFPPLAETPAAVRFVSLEPLLGPIDLARVPDIDPPGKLDWVIVGGESGPHARPMHPEWARSLRDQCAAAGISYFFKQHGEWHYIGDKPPQIVIRIGKKAAGRLLDGRTHDEFPQQEPAT